MLTEGAGQQFVASRDYLGNGLSYRQITTARQAGGSSCTRLESQYGAGLKWRRPSSIDQFYIKAFQAAVPHARLLELYGMLETGYHCSTRLTDDPLKVNGTVGRCVEEMSVRVIDDDGQDVPHGAVGEIAAVGPSVHVGYLDNPTANREAFTADGWFRTGDLGQFVDAEGNLRISGRKKEIINRGGKKYFSREIEELLYRHPKILQAAVVGAPDQRLGEKNCLCAMVKPGETLALDEIVTFLRGRVGDYKLPEALVVMDDFPMTPTGKIRRPELVKRVAGRC